METIKDFLKPEIIWFLIGLVLLILEFVMPGLIIFFFGVGAWIVALICLITDIGINTQLIIFITCSVLSLLVLRLWVKGVFFGHTESKQDLKQKLEDFLHAPGNMSLSNVPSAIQTDGNQRGKNEQLLPNPKVTGRRR